MLVNFLIALSLAMDCFAVSISSGIAIKQLRLKHIVLIAFFFGSFQAIMPVLGWLAGVGLGRFVAGVDHWIVFTILAFIGVKMIYEAIKVGEAEKIANPLDLYSLIILSIATSIDAFAVGTSFALLNVVILVPVVIIGVVTFVMSIIGTLIGNKLGHFFEKKIEILGGLILIGIGIKIVLEHIL